MSQRPDGPRRFLRSERSKRVRPRPPLRRARRSGRLGAPAMLQRVAAALGTLRRGAVADQQAQAGDAGAHALARGERKPAGRGEVGLRALAGQLGDDAGERAAAQPLLHRPEHVGRPGDVAGPAGATVKARTGRGRGHRARRPRPGRSRSRSTAPRRARCRCAGAATATAKPLVAPSWNGAAGASSCSAPQASPPPSTASIGAESCSPPVLVRQRRPELRIEAGQGLAETLERGLGRGRAHETMANPCNVHVLF